MKAGTKMVLAPFAAVAIGSMLLHGCGNSGGGSDDIAMVAGVAVPVAGANSPFIGVTMKVTCANGATGSGSIGTSALPGEGSITVNGGCTPPIRIEATGAGKMRPIGAKTDGSEDIVYDPAINLPVSNLIAAVPTTPVPVNPVTTLVAAQVSAAGLASETATTLDAKKTAVASALGLAGGRADLDHDYRNAGVAEAATKLVEVAALAAANAATGGMPASVTSTKSLGQVIAEGLGNQARTAAANTLNNAAGIATVLKAVDAKLDVSGAASLPAIDSDATRVNNLIALNVPASTTSGGKVNELIAAAATAAAAAAAPSAAQTQLVADINARRQQAAQDSVRTSAAKMVADIATTSGISTVAVDIARAAATKIVADQATSMQQTGARPADIAAQAKVIAESVTAAIKADAVATTKAFATSPAVGAAGAAAALVGQLENSAAVKAVTAVSAAAVNSSAAGADALKVATAVKDIAAPAAADATTLAAFQGAIGAVAGTVDPTRLNATDAATKSNLAATVGSLQTSLATAIGTAPTEIGVAGALAQQAGLTALGTTKLDFATPPAPGTVAVTLPTTTTASSTSSTAKLTTTTAAAGTTTAGATTTTAAAPPAPTTTTGAATTTTAASATTTTLPLCDPLAPPPAPGATPTCRTTTAPTTTSTTAATSTTMTTSSITTTTTAALPLCDPLAPPPVPGATPTCRTPTAGETTTTAAGTTSTVATTTTTTAATGTLPICDPLAPPPAPGVPATCQPGTSGTTTTTAITTTTTATTTSTTAAFNVAGCEVRLGSAVGYISGVTSSSQCVSTGAGSFNINGGGAVVTGVTTIPSGATAVAVGSLTACDPFGAPPVAGATTLTPCKN